MKLNLAKPVVVLRQKAFSFPNTWSQCVQAQCRAKVEEFLHLLPGDNILIQVTCDLFFIL